MLTFVRVMAGADPAFQAHIEAVHTVFLKAFPFNEPYIDKITRYATGENPPKAEAVLLAALKGNKVLGFSVSFYFADLKAAYLDYIASDPAR